MDSFLGKLVVMGRLFNMPPERLVFELLTAGKVTGCAYVATERAAVQFPPPPHVQWTDRACQSLAGWRN